MSTEETKVFPEAGAVAYTTYKRTDGFEVSITLRDVTGTGVMDRLGKAIEKIKQEGGTPIPLRGNGFPKKQVEVVPGKKCPKCGADLVNAQTKVGKKFVKCSTNKWDFATKQATGCDYVEWPEMSQADL